MSVHQSAQPPHNNRPDNQADWLDEVLSYITSQIPPNPKNYENFVKAKAAITTKIAEERIDEIRRFDTRRHYGKDYQDSLDELDEYKEKRIAELETLKGDK